jgi:hypothetical protein
MNGIEVNEITWCVLMRNVPKFRVARPCSEKQVLHNMEDACQGAVCRNAKGKRKELAGMSNSAESSL